MKLLKKYTKKTYDLILFFTPHRGLHQCEFQQNKSKMDKYVATSHTYPVECGVHRFLLSLIS
ncbi:hypothetical protein Pint_17438 [Pistacia integerrima]|uniref:Uncharacterized protein n=1 Tax=Pistacia integerrima TaxID=434235 RepID=A0ACC0Z2B2_9ROSI|nr:hypothetical protein Pint_17438 [Pistacia integerrima]